jgi:hypothetical protein
MSVGVVNTDRRALAIWTSVHANGWVANAIERPDGTFAAWATNDATADVDYVEDGPENAKRAAEFALARKSGHDQCSPLCLGWRVHFHELP